MPDQAMPSELAAPTPAPTNVPAPLVELDDVAVHYGARRGGACLVRALDGVTIDIAGGQTFGLVGESGSGKSTLGRVITGMASVTSGRLRIAGTDMPADRYGPRAAHRAGVQMVFQNPSESLSPRRSIRQTLREGIGRVGESRQTLDRAAAGLLAQVDLPASALDKYPFELSGGQQQRVAIARALASKPRLIVLDEAVSALDMSTQAGVLDLLLRIQEETATAYLFISHDMDAVRFVSDRVAVMYLGKIVEVGEVGEVHDQAAHPYTVCLNSAVPRLADGMAGKVASAIAIGEPDSATAVPSGCRFHRRCPIAELPLCRDVVPPDVAVPARGRGPSAADHKAQCHFAGEFWQRYPRTAAANVAIEAVR
jgi:peptide/nickel transport system ATP-binding protein